MSRHLIRDDTTAKVVGWAVFILGGWLLRDAYDQRGHDQPVWARPFTWW